MTELRRLDDPAGPLFAYGPLQPGELAFSQVKPFVASSERARVRGTLRVRDGIPLFDPGGDGQVAGWLLWFDSGSLDRAWSAVCAFEPAGQYTWQVADVVAEPDVRTPANVVGFVVCTWFGSVLC